jgi:hypothetical protein
MAKQENQFKAGDRVIFQNGKLPMTVQAVGGNYVRAVYDHSKQQSNEHHARYKFYEEEGQTMTSTAIYKINVDGDNPKSLFAHYRGTDSAGNWLMERIGDGGGIMVVSKEKCEEVLPYTFSVRMNGREQHFQGEAGKVKKGDILLYTAGGVDNFAFAVVKNVDTKNKGAKAWEGVRVLTEAI